MQSCSARGKGSERIDATHAFSSSYTAKGIFICGWRAMRSLFGDRCDRSDLSQIYIDMVILHFICRHLPMWHMQSAHVC